MTDTGVTTHLDNLERRMQAVEARLGLGSGTPVPVGRKPADVLDLSRWKLTLPLGEAEKPREILPAALRLFSSEPWFVVVGDAVRFRAAVNGVTTSGSDYPRCELRELNADGSLAAWSSSKGRHTVTAVEAFTALPAQKPHAVGLQLHDGKNDLSVFRLEGSKLWVTNGDKKHQLVTDTYELGARFEAKFVVENDKIQAFHNGRLVTTIGKKFSKAFAKCGVYTQANCGNSKPCSVTNYGEVLVYSLAVSHT